MNLEKANLKILVANDLGADLEDRLDGEQKAASELTGAAHALRQAAKKVPLDLVAKLDRAVEAGEIPESLEGLEAVQWIKKYLAKVGDFLSHLADVEQQKAVAQAGRVDGLREAMKLVQKTRDSEAQKIKAFTDVLQGEEDAVVNARTASELARATRGSLSDRRKAEDSGVEQEAASSVADADAQAEAAKAEHGNLADRRASKETPPKKRRVKGKLQAVKRDG